MPKAAATTPKTPRSKANIHDVAKAAGVSIATVSRVLNKNKTVRSDMQERVMAAARSLGYTANSVGQALRTQRTHVIGTMLPKIDDPIFSIIGAGVQETLLARGYVGFMQTIGFDNRDLFDHAMSMIEKGAEGLIVVGQVQDERLLTYCQEFSFPIVSVYSYTESGALPSVGFDNYEAARQLLDMLAQFGHRKICMIAGTTDGNDRQARRVDAYNAFMAELGEEPIVETLDMTRDYATGASALRRILSRRPDVTAVLCNRDEIAFSVLAECRRRRIRVPEDLSVTGFDDLEHAALFNPSVTTAAVPARKMAEHAAEAIMNLLDSGSAIESARYETEVILRESTSRPKV
ncbi:LacI family DNA-binding transcriptional regulator [Yangia mangrovi]|uniref:LacI family DNA-binding transcriptional regulator n=1 Tax=Alloyangia mangrovi TaxID=1779329 RepID=A0A2A3JY06_9RHOB|nr:LacI family DNA-binding transcriptional regulator [Alloyangia mangrovi]MCT4371614.1 LacI family DNA-binding transcriptional regulator [Alloyangia mangrovi]